MSTKPTTDENSTDTEPTTNDYDWCVESDGMILAKDSYEYILGHRSLSVTFDGLRDPNNDYNDGDEGEYELRDDHDVQGYFDPTDESVPDAVATAFRVLAGEL